MYQQSGGMFCSWTCASLAPNSCCSAHSGACCRPWWCLHPERSHKRSLIEHLEVQQAEVKRLEERLRDLGQVKNEVDYVSEEAVYGQATRAQRAELALRWFEANAAWDVVDTLGRRGIAKPPAPTRR